MAINKITAATSDSPSTFASPVINYLAALLANVNHGARNDDTNILQGALFCIGGAMFLADSDTAISGTRYVSQWIKFTVSGDTATASYADVLTSDLTWNGSYQGYYDDDGNYYYKGLSVVSNSGISKAFVSTLPTSYNSTYSGSTTVTYGGTVSLGLISSGTSSLNNGTLYIKTTLNGVQISEKTIVVDGSYNESFDLGNKHVESGDIFAVYVKRNDSSESAILGTNISLSLGSVS